MEQSEEHTFVYNLHGGGYLNILIVCCTLILDIFIIVIIGCPILNCMIHYNVCNEKGKYCGPVGISVGDWNL